MVRFSRLGSPEGASFATAPAAPNPPGALVFPFAMIRFSRRFASLMYMTTPSRSGSPFPQRRSAENLFGHRLEPATREIRFQGTSGARRVQRTHAARVLDLLELAVRRPIDPGARSAV